MDDQRRRPSFWQVIGSVLASFVGVQSQRNRARDFRHGKVWHYLVAGAAMTLLLILLIYGAVRLALNAAGV